MLAVAGGMALLLGVIGIYGVIAYSVSQRTREIGIRMALGAERRQMISMFVRDGVRLTTIGGLIGLIAAFLLMRLLSSLLFDVSPVDPLTYLIVSAALLGAAALASYVPSRRAAAIDPAVALRIE
jgi:ABC-type antimicrobial peptide transport system permease subunit